MSNPSMFQNWLGATKSFSSPEEAKSFCLDNIEEISILEKELPVAHQRIIYCHGDFQCSNITIDGETNSITISVILFFSLLVI